jgi:hypothetical protein
MVRVGVLVAAPRVAAKVLVPADEDASVMVVPPEGEGEGFPKASSSCRVRGPLAAVVDAGPVVGALRYLMREGEPARIVAGWLVLARLAADTVMVGVPARVSP